MNMIYICKDNDDNYPTLRKDIYIGRIGQVTTLNRHSPLGGPKTTKENLAQLQGNFALSNIQSNLGLPNTIRDAIGLIGLLEERYLWVDALCIVQDDEETRHEQIINMTSIFANACLTIITNQGNDAQFGLRGLRGISQLRSLRQDIIRLEKGLNIA